MASRISLEDGSERLNSTDSRQFGVHASASDAQEENFIESFNDAVAVDFLGAFSSETLLPDEDACTPPRVFQSRQHVEPNYVASQLEVIHVEDSPPPPALVLLYPRAFDGLGVTMVAQTLNETFDPSVAPSKEQHPSIHSNIDHSMQCEKRKKLVGPPLGIPGTSCYALNGTDVKEIQNKGRRDALGDEKRAKAAAVRVVGACSRCRRRKISVSRLHEQPPGSRI